MLEMLALGLLIAQVNEAPAGAGPACAVTAYQDKTTGTPAYTDASPLRDHTVGAELATRFPLPVLFYDGEQDRVAVAQTMPPADDAAGETQAEQRLVWLQRNHVSLSGEDCPQPDPIQPSPRCNSQNLFAQRGSNSSGCEDDEG